MLHLITITLIVLKALGYLDISWFLVILPSLIPVFIIVTGIFIALIVGVRNTVKHLKNKS